MSLVYRAVPSPIGSLTLFAQGDALVALVFPTHTPSAQGVPEQAARLATRHPVLDLAARELDQYFQGRRRVFRTPLRAEGTEFQKAVWRALAAIPFGEIRSYADIARAVGNPKAVRAVGAANGRNPLAIFVPCHRVIGRDGSLTGFGGGLSTKRWLLEHERADGQATLNFAAL